MLPHPSKIERHSDTEMLLSWKSPGSGAPLEESYALPYFELRFQCPCASCVDEHTGKRVLKREQVAPDVRPLGVSLVGRYAVQISWSDGHSSGIYPFDKLYPLCKAAGKKL